MWLTAHVRQRAGALSSAAEHFVDRRWGTNGGVYRSGREGLTALCRQIESFAHESQVDEEDERQFVEGAGALLGVLLIDHLADAHYACERGTHRVKLGAYGFFDPFAAIDRVLDAPNIRVALAREVERAEAEAHARGPISRVVFALCAAIASERSDLQVVDQFECHLRLIERASGEPIEIDLRRAVESTWDQDLRAVENVARRILSLLPGAPAAGPPDVADLKHRLVPRVVRREALNGLTSQGQNLLFARPFCEELAVALLAEYDGRARYLRSAELSAMKLETGEALAIALDNLRTKSGHTRLVREAHGDGAIFVARTGDGRDSARVLLPELYDELRARVGASVCIALPHRDTFFACDATAEPLRLSLARRAAEDAARAPHALSARIFALASGTLRELHS